MKHSYVCQDALVRYSNEEFNLCAQYKGYYHYQNNTLPLDEQMALSIKQNESIVSSINCMRVKQTCRQFSRKLKAKNSNFDDKKGNLRNSHSGRI